MMKKPSRYDCMAHVQSVEGQAVAAELHVLVSPSIDGGFIAQGIEIDFVASGETEEAVRDHFAQSFCATILSYLKRGRDLSGLFKTDSPAECRQAYFANPQGHVFRCAVGLKSEGKVPETAPVPEFLNFVHAVRAHA